MGYKENIYFQKAQEFISKTDLMTLPLGKNEIDGDNLFVNVIEIDLKEATKVRFEAHKAYIDIQIPLTGEESYGVMPVSKCVVPDGGYSAQKDVTMYDDPVADFFENDKPAPGVKIASCKPGEQIVFLPKDAHAPGIGSGHLRKVIFKVKIV